MDPSPVPPSAPAPLPVRASRATLVNIIGWPAVTLLTAGYLVLIARLTSFPFEDFPNHLARAKVLADLLFHQGRQWGGVFAFHWQLVPYLLHDLILTSLVAMLGTTAGGAVFNGIVVLSLPRALLYYMRVHACQQARAAGTAASYVLSRTRPSKSSLPTAGRARLIDAAGNRAHPSPMIWHHTRHV